DTFGSPENAFWVGAFSTVILTGFYTIFGGMRAVLYTDAMQAFILLGGAIFITYFGLSQLGGYSELKAIIGQDADKFALWRPLSDPEFPWLGVMIASPIIGIWYWCTDQYIVQRTLSARNMATARRGALFGGFMKVWPVLIFLVPGMIGYALHQKGVIQIPLDASGEIMGDQVFPTMVANLLPTGLRGLVVGGLLAALMSSLSSLFNSCASLFTIDFYEKFRPGRSQKEYVRVGRYATAVVVGLGMLWIPVMKLVASGGLYQYLQSVQGYLAPPITAVFLLGLFWQRINSQGAVAGMAFGFLIGLSKLTIQTFFGADKISSSPILAFIGDYSFLYASGWLFLISLITIISISLLTPPPRADQIDGLTYASITKDGGKLHEDVTWFDISLTIVVLGLVLGMYLFFSFWI
ncbi:MAG: sodium/solute symporter, partial [Kordiimonadaceae bacterium]|nr:sodium/solute symporter [Kordiimonadaceae bacterium]